jgi:mannose-6-phosphate isomerase-like protein (cupin superfamily)
VTEQKKPLGHVRRVVTGHDARGKAIVISDGAAPLVHTVPQRPGYCSTDIWRTKETPARIAARADEPTQGPRRQLPEPKGTVVRINRFEPESESVRQMGVEEARKVFAGLGNSAASTFGTSGRHPLMHRTETIDYAIVLSGEIYMILDESEVLLKAGDVVVQCGTNHAWSNRSSNPCTVAFVLIDGVYTDDLKQSLR